MITSEKTVVQAALEACFTATNEYHRAARALRNRLLVMTVIALVTASLLILMQWRIPSAAFVEQPHGTHIAKAQFVAILMLFGALGALLTTIGPISTLGPAASPFNFPLQSAFLKIAVGTLTATVGTIVFGATTATTQSQSLATLIGAAVVFGAAQQTVTQFLDKRATSLVASSPTLGS